MRGSQIHTSYTGPTGGSGFIQMGGQGFLVRCSQILTSYTGPTGGSSFIQNGGHGFQ